MRRLLVFLAGLGAEVIRIDSPAGANSVAVAPPYAGRDGVSFERTSPDDLSVNYLKRTEGVDVYDFGRPAAARL